MNIRNLAKILIPHGIYLWLSQRKNKKSEYVNDWLEEIDTQDSVDNSTVEPKQIISVQGFGYSGSGAIVDVMREYECNRVWGGYDIENTPVDSKKEIKQQPRAEIDIMRLSGGILELEKLITEQNVFIKDAAIRRFISLVDSWLALQSDNAIILSKGFKNAIKQFLGSIIDFKIPVGNKNPYNYHLYKNSLTSNNYIFFLKEITVMDYQKYARSFLENIFKLGGGKDILVLDQFCMDFNLDMNNLLKYVNNLKVIQIYRDPRDVYMTACEHNVEWIPTNSIEEFVKWYKICHKCIDNKKSNEQLLIIRFEDIVNDYDNTIDIIQKFTNITHSQHVNKLKFFDPAISKKNIGIWRNAEGSKKTFVEGIYNSLPEFCYQKNKI